MQIFPLLFQTVWMPHLEFGETSESPATLTDGGRRRRWWRKVMERKIRFPSQIRRVNRWI